jgi:hypothetical protein
VPRTATNMSACGWLQLSSPAAITLPNQRECNAAYVHSACAHGAQLTVHERV